MGLLIKKYLLLLFLLIPNLVFGDAAVLEEIAQTISVADSGYLVHETAETTGSCETWTATVNFDYTTSPMSGSQMIEIDYSPAENGYTDFTAQDEVWIAWEWRVDSDAGYYNSIYFRDSANNNLGYLALRGGGNSVRVYNTGGTYVTVTIDKSGAEQWIKVRLKKGTGSNAEIEFWQTTNSGAGWGSSSSTTN